MTEASEGGVLLSEDLGPVRRLTLNRPASLNALNAELMDALEAAFDAAAEDDEVRVVVLRGAGRAFCAGYDLNQDAEEGTKDAAEWHRELDRDTQRLLRILELPEARHRVRALVLPRRRHRPDARVRSRRGLGRRDVRVRRHPVRLGRRLDVPAVGGRGARGQGADPDGAGPGPGRRGAPDRSGEPGRAARRARRRDDGARGRDREERTVRRPDDEGVDQPRVADRRAPGRRSTPTRSWT